MKNTRCWPSQRRLRIKVKLRGILSNNYVSDRLDTTANALDNDETRIRATDVQAFEDATQEARRLSVTFRFHEGTNSLDSRAEADLERLVGLMQLPAYGKSRLVLIGFSAAWGDYLSDRSLSRERAAAGRTMSGGGMMGAGGDGRWMWGADERLG